MSQYAALEAFPPKEGFKQPYSVAMNRAPTPQKGDPKTLISQDGAAPQINLFLPKKHMEPNTNNRTIYNPVQKDYVTFLKTSAETNGAFTFIECSVAPGGGVGLHYHKTYEETFEPLEGILSVECNGVAKQYGVGESVTAGRRMNHRFFNEMEQECRFLCKMTPGQPGLEAALQIGYGLARDGKTNKGLPKDPQVLAYLIQLSETNLPGWRSVFEWILRWQARSFIKKGGEKGLRETYVQI